MLKPPSPLPQRRLSRLEGQYLVRTPALTARTPAADPGEQVMQSQMIGMQSSLDRILSAIQSQNQALVQGGPAYPPPGGPSRESPVMTGPMPPQRNNEMYGNSPGGQGDGPPRPRAFPPLPGFAPPVRSSLPTTMLCDLPGFCTYSRTSTRRTVLCRVQRRPRTTSRKTHSLARHSTRLLRLYRGLQMLLQRLPPPRLPSLPGT